MNLTYVAIAGVCIALYFFWKNGTLKPAVAAVEQVVEKVKASQTSTLGAAPLVEIQKWLDDLETRNKAKEALREKLK